MSSVRKDLSVAEAYHEYTLETYKSPGTLFQCGLCLEKNTRHYLVCCEGKTKNSSYICSGCWAGWFGNQRNLHCPFPYCKEKLFSKPLEEVSGYKSRRSITCPCCGRTQHLDVHTQTIRDDQGKEINVSFSGTPPPGFNFQGALSQIKSLIAQQANNGSDHVVISGTMDMNGRPQNVRTSTSMSPD